MPHANIGNQDPPADRQSSRKVIFLTAGAAGMYCGSCLHDHLLAKAMISKGHDCILQPVYTPIRTDVESIARESVFFGGIHIYLIDRFPWLAKLPRWIWKPLDSPKLIRWATRRAPSTDAESLGHLTETMLAGEQGPLADEVHRLTEWISDESPDEIILSNLLIGGCLPELARKIPTARRTVLLQGDDIFLDHLPSQSRQRVVTQLRALVPHVDQLVVNSRFYGRLMSEILDVPNDAFRVERLSIDTKPFAELSQTTDAKPDFRIAYLARIAPEKGFDQLVDAFIEMATDDPTLHLDFGGYLAPSNQAYLNAQQTKVASAGLQNRFHCWGEVSLDQKIRLLSFADVLCVPTRYRDPKGLFILEANAAGTPVVQPNHGAFSELIEQTGGGLLYDPDTEGALVATLQQIRDDEELRIKLGQSGRERVLAHHDIDLAADRLLSS